MNMFEGLSFFRAKKENKKPLINREEGTGGPKLDSIIETIKNTPEVFDFVCKDILENNPKQFKSIKEVQKYISKGMDEKPLTVARLIESSMGSGTFRLLSFMDKDVDARRNVFKILKAREGEDSFERKAKKGMYMGIMESYDVQWNFEKASRDILQNFFDANGQTLDGIDIKSKKEDGNIVLEINGSQNYDWRELVHIGATTKAGSEESAGGFGEGAKVLSLVLLRDYDAESIKFSSRNWEVEYYLDNLPEESYRKPARGLYIRKNNVEQTEGNSLAVSFKRRGIDKVEELKKARELFYSSENRDFKNPSFNDPETGGFKILPLDKSSRYSSAPRGHFYLAGQRMNYDSRDKWETVEGLNIWTWKKVVSKDRDRGLITKDEMKSAVIPYIVKAMPEEKKREAVYQFKEHWDKGYSFQPNICLLEKITESLNEEGVRLDFESSCLANNISYKQSWIFDVFKNEGYRMCHSFLNNVGMKLATDRFKELQEHFKKEPTGEEIKKVKILKRISKIMGFEDLLIKDVWIFDEVAEKSIFSGQYNEMFYWMSRKSLQDKLLDVLHVYIHEASHAYGKHGDAEFEYGLQENIKKIQTFILERPGEYKRIETEWDDV